RRRPVRQPRRGEPDRRRRLGDLDRRPRDPDRGRRLLLLRLLRSRQGAGTGHLHGRARLREGEAMRRSLLATAAVLGAAAALAAVPAAATAAGGETTLRLNGPAAQA